MIGSGEFIAWKRLVIAGIEDIGDSLACEPPVQIGLMMQVSATEERGMKLPKQIDNMLPVQGFARGRLVIKDEERFSRSERAFLGLCKHGLHG